MVAKAVSKTQARYENRKFRDENKLRGGKK